MREIIASRFTGEEKRVIIKAAAIDKRSLSSFVRKATLDKASEILNDGGMNDG